MIRLTHRVFKWKLLKARIINLKWKQILIKAPQSKNWRKVAVSKIWSKIRTYSCLCRAPMTRWHDGNTPCWYLTTWSTKLRPTMGNSSSADRRKIAKSISSALQKNFPNFWLLVKRTQQNNPKLVSSQEYAPSYGKIWGNTCVKASEWSWSFLIKPAKKSYRIFGRSHSQCSSSVSIYTLKIKICLL